MSNAICRWRRVLACVAAITVAAPALLQAQAAPRDLKYDRLLSARHVQSRDGVRLDGKWMFRFGDNPSWSLPTYDDSGWDLVDPSNPIPDSLREKVRALENAGQPAIAWFRIHLTPERLLIRRPLALDFANRGAANVYLDAREILSLGDVDLPGTRAGVDVPVLPTPILFDSANSLLAVRINVGSAIALQRSTGRKDMFVASIEDGDAIGTVANDLRLYSSIMIALCGVFLAVGVFHFVLFVLLRHPVSNLHYAAFAGQFAIFPLASYLAAGSASIQHRILFNQIGSVAMCLALLALITFLYTSFNDGVPRYYPFICALLAATAAIIVGFVPAGPFWSSVASVLILIYCAEFVRVMVVAIAQRKNGAALIAAGASFVLLFFIFTVLNATGVVPDPGPRVAVALYMSWLGLAFAPSIHIAFQFAATTKGFQSLSGQLEQQVAVRTAELDEARIVAESASRTKSQFLANMSHELRTPLNAVIGYSEMLMEEAEDAGHEGYVPDLRKIHGSGKHLLGLINDILDLSKIEAGRMELYFETFEVAPMVEEVASTIQPLIMRNGNELIVAVAADVGAVRLDQVKVRQILFNLLSNASKFTDHGTITLDVTRDGDSVRLRVADSGIGMSGEQIDRVFQPFIQADASTSKKYGGTGLGLTITQKFCEALGGTIDVASQPGRGTVFTVSLPTDGDTYSATMAAAPNIDVITSVATSGTVLVIDDDATAREMLQRMLTKEGYRVLLAATGDEGLRIAQSEHPDVITLDVLMAGLDGWGVLTRLKADELTASIPVLVVTVIDDRNLGFALGAADYLTKPVDRERLADALRRVRADATTGPVLIVDDDPNVREMLQRILERDGWSTVAAENGRVALDLMVNHTPSVILLDLMMPEMDGFTFIDELRNRGNAGVGMADMAPIIVLTAKTLTDSDRQRLHGAVTQVLSKGQHSTQELVNELRRAASGRVVTPAGGA